MQRQASVTMYVYDQRYSYCSSDKSKAGLKQLMAAAVGGVGGGGVGVYKH